MIAERIYDVRNPDGTSFPVVTGIGQPMQEPTGEWICGVCVVRNGHPQTFKIFGGDSLEALELGLEFLHRMVDLLRDDYGDRLIERGVADDDEDDDLPAEDWRLWNPS